MIAGHSASCATDVMGTVNASKSVLVIKPLATMVEDSESLCAMAAEKGVLAAMDAPRKQAKNGGLGRSARNQPAGIPATGRRDGVGGVRTGRCVPGQAENPRRRRARAAYWPVPSTHELNGVKALFAVLEPFRADGEKMVV